VVVAETEFWPNFLRLAKQGGARIAVINCRISDRSLPGYKRFRFWLPRLLEQTLANVDLFLPQTDEDRRRLIEIGAPESKIAIAGNLKFDMARRPRQRSLPVSARTSETPHPAQFWFAAARWKMKKAPCFPRFATFSPIIPRR